MASIRKFTRRALGAHVLCKTIVLFIALFQITNAKITPSKYELKFQNEPENVTLHKRERQQQLLRCQVKLAPVKSSQVLVNGSERLVNNKLKSHYEALDLNDQYNNPPLRLTNHPQRVNLTIIWLKNGQPLEEVQLEDQVTVFNVELKKSGSITSAQQDKSKISRIEIKNTLNAKQLKLTSRLKLSQLKVTDSGQYKCFARVTFIQVQPSGNQSSTLQPTTISTAHYKSQTAASNSNGNNKHEVSSASFSTSKSSPSSSSSIARVEAGSEELAASNTKLKVRFQPEVERPLALRWEQTLESSGASLVVVATNSLVSPLNSKYQVPFIQLLCL